MKTTDSANEGVDGDNDDDLYANVEEDAAVTSRGDLDSTPNLVEEGERSMTREVAEITTSQSYSGVFPILNLAINEFIYWNERRAVKHVKEGHDIGIDLWIIRIVGFFILLVFSTLTMLQPLAVILEIAPFDWDFVRSSKENCLPVFPLIVAVIFALLNCVIIVSGAWLAYRPAVVMPIWFVSFFGIMVVGAFLTFKLWKKYKNIIDNDTNTNDDVGPTESNNVS